MRRNKSTDVKNNLECIFKKANYLRISVENTPCPMKITSKNEMTNDLQDYL